VFPGGDLVVINAPRKLNVSDSCGHRIVDAEGNSHYMTPRWIHIYWTVKPGEPEFSF